MPSRARRNNRSVGYCFCTRLLSDSMFISIA
jgi:hypothetical protein